MIDREVIQKEYEFLKNDDWVYVDTCKVGIPPLRTQIMSEQFMTGYRDYARGINFGRYGELRSRVRKMLAELIGGGEDEIGLTKNTTEGVCILASGYPMGPGDNVVTCDLENQSNLFPWFNNAKLRGYEMRVAKTTRGRITPEEIEALMDENTKIVSLSAVQAGSGYFADLKAIGEICHRRGAIFAVDAIQAVGRMRINVKEMGIDYLSCGGFKGLLSGLGTGFLWCDRNIMNTLVPPYVGYMSAGPYISPPGVTSSDEDFYLVDGIDRLEAGTHNVHGISLMEGSVSLLLELGPANIESHVRGLEDYLREKLAGTRLDVLVHESPERQSGMLVMYYPKEYYEAASKVLDERHILLTHRSGYIRMAIGIHNTVEDMDKVAEALKEISDMLPA